MIEFFLTTLRLVRGVARAWRRDPEFRSLVFVVLVTLVGGTIFYSTIEGWSVVDAFYFSVTTLTTVGLGDLAPDHDDGQGLHGSLHLRWTQHHFGLHRHRCQGELAPPDREGR